MSSRLFYDGSEIEVEPGDHVAYRPFFSLRARPGRVIYIAEKDGQQLASQGQEPDDWYIELESGVRYGWLYAPEELQPNRRLRFVRRGGADFEPTRREHIDRDEEEESLQLSRGERAGCGLLALMTFLGWVVVSLR